MTTYRHYLYIYRKIKFWLENKIKSKQTHAKTYCKATLFHQSHDEISSAWVTHWWSLRNEEGPPMGAPCPISSASLPGPALLCPQTSPQTQPKAWGSRKEPLDFNSSRNLPLFSAPPRVTAPKALSNQEPGLTQPMLLCLPPSPSSPLGVQR